VKKPVEPTSHLDKGAAAYTWEQGLAEQDWALRWATQWSTIRERAASVVKILLTSVETQVSLPKLVMEIEDEEEEERDHEEEVDL
jgi:hypothetical protein